MLIVGGLATVSVAVLLAAPVPPLVELTAPVVLFFVPAVVPVTFTVSVQFVLIPTVPPASEITCVLAAAVTDPPQPFTAPGVLATVSPDGSVSLKATPFSETVLAAGLVMVKVTVVVPFNGMLAAPNALPIVGGATTASVAVLLVVPVPPFVELTAPVVLLFVPAVVPVRSTEIVHEPLAASAPLLKLIVPVPAVAVTVPPPQFPTTLGVAATCRPEGRVSVKATPVSPVPVFGLLMLKVS